MHKSTDQTSNTTRNAVTPTQSDWTVGPVCCSQFRWHVHALSRISLSPRLTLSVPGFDAPLERLFERARSPAPPHAPRSESSQTPSSPGLRLLSKMSGRVRDRLARRESPQPSFQPMPQTFSSTQRAVDIGRAVPRHASQKKRTLPAVRPCGWRPSVLCCSRGGIPISHFRRSGLRMPGRCLGQLGRRKSPGWRGHQPSRCT